MDCETCSEHFLTPLKVFLLVCTKVITRLTARFSRVLALLQRGIFWTAFDDSFTTSFPVTHEKKGADSHCKPHGVVRVF